jgi:hypothetical protein
MSAFMSRLSMRSFLVVLCLAESVPHAAAGQAAEPAGPGWTEVRLLAELPPQVQALLGVGQGGQDSEIADRGGRFSAGCIVMEGVPGKRFVRAMFNADSGSVTIEHGGIAHWFEKIEFRLADARWRMASRSPQDLSAPHSKPEK